MNLAANTGRYNNYYNIYYYHSYYILLYIIYNFIIIIIYYYICMQYLTLNKFSSVIQLTKLYRLHIDVVVGVV